MNFKETDKKEEIDLYVYTAMVQTARFIVTAEDKASAVLKNTTKNIKQASEGIKGFASSASKSMQSLSKSIEKNKESIQRIRNVSGAAFAGITAGVGLAVNSFATFEKQMSTVKAITGSTGEEFKELEKIAKEMGATTQFTATESAQALEFLGMAGLSAQESIAALPGTLELASAGGLELASAADIATNIMAQFGIEAENIGRVNDVLAKSATSSNTSVLELSEAMKFLGPVANALGVSLEESAASLNVLANNGIKGSNAGQAFSASLLRITKLTPQMEKSMNALNLSLFDQEGSYVGITETIRQLEEGTRNMTDEQKAQHISTLFGIQSSKQRLSLLKDGSGALNEYTSDLEDAEGAAKLMAEIKLNNLTGSITLLQSATSAVAIEIGQVFAPMIRSAADLIAGLASKLSVWISENPNLARTIGIVAVAVTGLLTAITTIGLLLPSIAAGFSALGTAITFMAGPIGIVITLVGVLVAAFVNDRGGIRTFVVETAKEIGEALSNTWSWIVDTATAAFEGLRSFFESIWTNITAIFALQFQIISEIFTFFSEIFGEEFQTFLNNIKMIFEAGRNGITQFFVSIWNGLRNIAKNVGKSIREFIVGWISGIAGFFTGEGRTLFENGFRNMTSGLTGIVKNVANGVIGLFEGMVNKAIALINKLIEAANQLPGISIGTISEISLPRLRKGGFAMGPSLGDIFGENKFQDGGMVSGPSGIDRVPALLTAGELVLNRAQQENLAGQLNGGGGMVVNVNISGNSFFGDDEEFADRIGEQIVRDLKDSTIFQSF